METWFYHQSHLLKICHWRCKYWYWNSLLSSRFTFFPFDDFRLWIQMNCWTPASNVKINLITATSPMQEYRKSKVEHDLTSAWADDVRVCESTARTMRIDLSNFFVEMRVIFWENFSMMLPSTNVIFWLVQCTSILNRKSSIKNLILINPWEPSDDLFYFDQYRKKSDMLEHKTMIKELVYDWTRKRIFSIYFVECQEWQGRFRTNSRII